MEGREEEGADGGPVRHHGHAQRLLTVPPSNKSTPHITGLLSHGDVPLLSVFTGAEAVHPSEGKEHCGGL